MSRRRLWSSNKPVRCPRDTSVSPDARYICRLLDDSARWQLVTKRYEAADRGIKKMAKWNGTVIPADFDVMTIEVLPFPCCIHYHTRLLTV